MAKKPKLLSELFSRHPQGCLFRRNQNPENTAEDGKGCAFERPEGGFRQAREGNPSKVKRLEQVFKIFGKKPQAKKCEAIMGITKEGAEIMTDYKGMPALDAGLAAAAQAVEHYEMSRYGTLRTWAEELGMPDAAALLEATLKEEKATDAALTSLAKAVVNVEAEAAL